MDEIRITRSTHVLDYCAWVDYFCVQSTVIRMGFGFKTASNIGSVNDNLWSGPQLHYIHKKWRLRRISKNLCSQQRNKYLAEQLDG